MSSSWFSLGAGLARRAWLAGLCAGALAACGEEVSPAPPTRLAGEVSVSGATTAPPQLRLAVVLEGQGGGAPPWEAASTPVAGRLPAAFSLVLPATPDASTLERRGGFAAARGTFVLYVDEDSNGRLDLGLEPAAVPLEESCAGCGPRNPWLVVYLSGTPGDLGPCLGSVALAQGYNVIREEQGPPPDGGGALPTTCTLVDRAAPLQLRFDRLP